MAGFGGAVKLTGANEYKNALAQITQSLKTVSAEMKATSSAFASGDKSQKDILMSTKELKTALEQQKSALSTLKGQLSQMTAEYQKTGQKHQALVKEYESEKTKLLEIEKTLGTSSNEYKNQQKVVADLEQEVTKSSKAYDAQGKAVNDMRTRTANAETTVNQTAKALDDLSEEALRAGASAEKGGDGFTVMKGVLADLASKAVQSAIQGLKNLGSAIVDVGKQSYNLYAQNEQLVGGVETLFGESADKLIEYANQAYKTAGLSANDYMEQATSFSATLLQGLGGDTAKAVEYADLAIRDMSDNANKMGTDMSMIQNAYQGFAKDNYSMLDNLKLGYGGTQEEMARLINDSGVLGDSIKVNAKTVKDVPFDKIIEAIHKTQQEIGITGTTAEEAAGTIEGSTKAMQAAWENLLVGIASGDADISGLTDDLVRQVVTMGKNMIPRIKEIISGMGELVTAVWNEVIPALAEEFPQLQPIVDAMNWIKENADYIIAGLAGILAGFVAFKTVSFITGLVSAVQGLFAAIQAGIPIMQALNLTLNMSPIGLIVSGITALVAAFAVLWNTSDGFRQFWIDLWNNIKEAFSNVWEAITGFFTTTLPETLGAVKDKILEWKDNVVDFFKQIPPKISEMIKNAVTFLKQLPYNLGLIVGQALGHLVKFGADAWIWVTTKIPEIINGIVKFFSELPNKIWTWLQNTFEKIKTWGSNAIAKAKETGKEFVENVVNFVKDLPNKVWTWLQNTITKVGTFAKDIASKAKEGAKNMFDNIVNGIKSLPDTIKDVGKNIVEGLWNGITGAGEWLLKKVKEFAKGVLDGMKEALGIKSPSRLFRDQVGKNIALGVGEGFEQEMKNVASQMNDAIPTSFDTDVTVGSSRSTGSGYAFDSMVSAFKEALYQVKIEMDDEQMGKFIDKTVTRLVYR
jgi:phage-related protein